MTTDLKKDLNLTLSTVTRRFSKSSNQDLTKSTMACDIEMLIPTGATDLFSDGRQRDRDDGNRLSAVAILTSLFLAISTRKSRKLCLTSDSFPSSSLSSPYNFYLIKLRRLKY